MLSGPLYPCQSGKQCVPSLSRMLAGSMSIWLVCKVILLILLARQAIRDEQQVNHVRGRVHIPLYRDVVRVGALGDLHLSQRVQTSEASRVAHGLQLCRRGHSALREGPHSWVTQHRHIESGPVDSRSETGRLSDSR
jgi:hypothetical protein